MKIKPIRQNNVFAYLKARYARKFAQGMSNMIERDCIDSDINSALPDETMMENSRDEFQRQRLADVDCIGLRNIQILLLICTKIRRKSYIRSELH